MADTKDTDDIGGLDMGGDDVIVTLESKDKKTFEVSKANAKISKVVDVALDTNADTTKVPLPGVPSASLELVIEYMNHHKGTEPELIKKPLASKVMAEVVKDKWDATFIEKIGEDRQALYDLILAANYMDIKGLLHLGCAKVASLIKGQPLEKIKDILAKGTKAEAAK